MAHIVLIDDDFALEIFGDTLHNIGHDARTIRSTDDALRDVNSIASADLVILDVMMPPPTSEESASGGRTAGMSIYRALRQANTALPILAYTASTDKDVLAVFDRDPHTTLINKWSAPSMRDVIATIDQVLGIALPSAPPRPFIVHGRDDATKLAVKNYVQNVLKLPEPIILHEQPSLGRTIIEKFEHFALQTQLVFVLLTPDDLGALATDPDDQKRRARQNVIFELGFFLGTLGRLSGRVFLLYKGSLELPSDLAGVCYIDITNGIEAAGEAIRRELPHVR